VTRDLIQFNKHLMVGLNSEELLEEEGRMRNEFGFGELEVWEKNSNSILTW
jgi:hypothetical protein